MHRGALDQTPDVVDFAENLEQVIITTVESGRMTADLAGLIGPDTPFLTTEQFLEVLDEGVKAHLLAR